MMWLKSPIGRLKGNSTDSSIMKMNIYQPIKSVTKKTAPAAYTPRLAFF